MQDLSACPQRAEFADLGSAPMIFRFLERPGKRISADKNAVGPSCNPDPLLTETSLKSQPYEFIRSDLDPASDVAHQGSGPQRQLHTADPLGVEKFVAC